MNGKTALRQDMSQFEPPTEKAWRYMTSLPDCQDMPEGIFFLPDEPCVYYCLNPNAPKPYKEDVVRLQAFRNKDKIIV